MNIKLLLLPIVALFTVQVCVAQFTPGPANPADPCPGGSPCDNGDGTVDADDNGSTLDNENIGELCIVTNTNQSSASDVIGGNGVWNCDGFCMGLDALTSPDGVDYGDAGDGRCPNVASNPENCDGAECVFDCWWQPSNIFVSVDNGGICSTTGTEVINFTFRVRNPIDYCQPDDCAGIGCEVGLNIYDDTVDILEVEGTDNYPALTSGVGTTFGINNTSCGIYQFEDALTLTSSGDPCTPAVYTGTVSFGKASCTNAIEYEYDFRLYEPLIEDVHYTLPDNPSTCFGSITDLCGGLEILYSVDGVNYEDTIPLLLDGICPKNISYIIRADSLAAADCTVTGNYVLSDDVPPSATYPPDFQESFDNIPTILPCRGDFPVYAKGDFTPDDNCPFPLSTTLTSKLVANSCFEQLTFTYEVLDGCGNETEYKGVFIRAAVPATGTIANDGACGDNTIYAGATGGSSCYDGLPYDFTLANANDDAVVATQTSNSNGNGDVVFAGLAADTYYVIIEDGEGCIDTTDVVDVFDPFVVTEGATGCGLNINSFTLDNVTGGGATHVHATDALNSTGANFPTQYTVTSDIDGVLDAANPNVAYTPSQVLAPGCHTITVSDGALGSACDYVFEVEIYDAMDIQVASAGCTVFNEVDILSVAGGATPSVPCFSGDYNIFLSTTAAPAATADVAGPIDLADVIAGSEFTSVAAGNYFAVLEDARGCQVSVPVSVIDAATMSDDAAGDCDDPENEINVTAVGGYPDWDFYYYPQGTAFDGGGTAIGTDLGDGSTTDFTGNFTAVAPGLYTVYGVDDQNCFTLDVDVAVYDSLILDVSVDACTFNDFDFNSVTGGLDPAVFASSFYDISLNPDPNAIGTVQWNGGPLPDFGTLAGGSYDLTVVDGNNCSVTETVEVYDSIEVVFNLGLGCDDGGVIDITITGGQPAHPSFSFTAYNIISSIDGNIGLADASGNFSFSGLSPGEHDITVQYEHINSDGSPSGVFCSELIEEVGVYDAIDVTYVVDPCNAPNQITVTNITGGQDPSLGGTYTVIVSTDGSSNPSNDSNGTPMTFTVSNLATDLPLNITDVPSASTYYIVIQDGTTDALGNLCEVSFGTIDVNDAQSLDIVNTGCNTFNTINASMLGGQAPFDYFVYPFGDALVSPPPAYNYANNVGGAALDANGASLSLQFAPLPALFTNVIAGTYTVYGVDFNQCPESSATAEAYDPFDLQVESLVCQGQNAVEVTAVSGGRDPNVTVGGGFAGAGYTIFMSTTAAPGAINDVVTNEGTLTGIGTFTGLTPGSYFVVMEDDRGCQYSVPVELTVPEDLTVEPGVCNGSANAAGVTVTGGNPDWDFYLVENGDAFDPLNPTTNAVATDLGNGSGVDMVGLFNNVAAGAYTAYGIDATGCVTNPADLEVYDSLKVEIDYNGCFFEGTVDVTNVSGGADPAVTVGGGFASTGYTVFLSSDGTTNDIASNEGTLTGIGTFTGIVATADFYVVVEDANGCQANELIEYLEQVELTNDIPEACGNGVNVAQVSATGGTPGWDFYLYEVGFAFDENNPATGATAVDASSGGSDAVGNFNNVAAGNYFVFGQDSEGCPADTVAVTVYDSLKLEIDLNACFFDGEVEVTSVTGGADPAVTVGGGFASTGYVVFLSTTPAPGATNNITSNENSLTGAGTFTGIGATETFYVVVEDARGCQYSEEVEVVEQLDLTNNTSEACGAIVSQVDVSATGGTPDWDFYLYEGGFAFDENNPATGAVATDLGSGGSDQSGIFPGVAPGVYFAFGVDSEGCPADTVAVTVYDTLSMEIDVNGCFFDGLVDVTSVSGGADPAVTVGGGFPASGYTVFLSSNGTANDIASNEGTLTGVGSFTGVVATNNFFVVLEDARGCQYPIEVEVLEQATLTDNTGTDCNSGINQASVSADGGTPGWDFYMLATGLTFDENNPAGNAIATDLSSGAGDTQGLFSNIPAGNYTVYGLDANSCPSDSVVVMVYDSLKLEIDFNPCPFDGTVEITAMSGGVDPAVTVGGGYPITGYTVFLSTTPAPGATNNYPSNEGTFNSLGTFTGVPAGTFYVVLEDFRGCQTSIEVEVSEDPELTETTTACDYGQIGLSVTGGLPNWDFYVYPQGTAFDDANPTSGVVNDNNGGALTASGAAGINFSEVPAGNYTVYATDQSDCPAISIDVSTSDPFEIEETNLCNYGELSVTATGGFSSNLTFSISPAVAADNTTGVFANVPAGNYTITVTDDNPDGQCSETIDVTAYDPIAVDPDQSCYEGIVVTGGAPTYTYNLYTPDGSTLIASNFTGIFPNTNGEYLLIIQDSNGCDNAPGVLITCEPPIECETEANITPTCLDDFNYEIAFELTVGEGTYVVTDGTDTYTGQVIGDTQTFGPYPNGAYTITVTSELDSSCIVEFSGDEDCTPPPCNLELSENVLCNADGSFSVDLTISGDDNYTIFPTGGTPLAGAPAGTYNFGPYSAGSAFEFAVISQANSECADTISNTPYCCLLAPTASVNCVDAATYTVAYTIDGLGTFTVNDGISTQTLSAGNYVAGPYPNGPYSITITSDTDASCSQTLSGDEDCYECELDLQPTITCVDLFSYGVSFAITGDGTYTIDDGSGSPVTGASAGTYNHGPYPNGPYSITVTSEIDATCTQTISGNEDCYECELDVSPAITCVDVFNFEVGFTISGGDTYTIDDGSGSPVTGAAAGNYTFGPYPNGAYSIIITSEFDPLCTETLSGNEDCFECDLDPSANTTCIDPFTFNVDYTIAGSGTYTVDDGVNPLQTGVVAGNYTVGPFNNEDVYTIIITSEYDATCTETLSGSDDCFECDLEASANTVCADFFSYNVNYSFTGTGTYTIDDGVNPVQTGVSAGAFSVGPFDNEAPYNIVITSEENPDCVETLSGTDDCFECDLALSSNTTCVDFFNFSAEYTITGSGTYTVDDGINPLQTGIVAGTYSLGSFANETSITVVVTSEEDATCTETVTITDDCFECDLELASNTTCIDNFNFSAEYTITGSGTYTVDDGINPLQTGIVAGTYSLGSFVNETSITVIVTSEEDATCTETVTITDDCFECDLSASATATCIEGTLTYNVEYTITGSGTYTVNDGLNPAQTGVTAGTYTVGLFDSEAPYNIIITSEEDATCTETLSGTTTCYECELELNPTVECIDEASYQVSYSITGTGTYTVTDANETQTGVVAGNYSSTYPNGTYSVTVTSETDPNCTATASGELDCFECDLELVVATSCIDEETYNVLVNITGSGTFTVSDGINPDQTGVTAGNIVVGPIDNGSYNVTVTSEIDPTCFQAVSGADDCTVDVPCDLNATASTNCIDETQYNLSITLNGTSTYTVTTVNGTLTNIGAGVLDLGAFANGAYSVTITSEVDPECTITLSGTDDCTNPIPCDVSATPNTTCINNGGAFELDLDLSGSSTYQIDLTVGDDVFVFNNAAGIVDLGTYSPGAYSIVITDENDDECTITLTGNEPCDEECDLEVSINPVCINQTSFDVEVVIGGSDTYDIFVTPGNSSQFGVNAGTYTVGDFDNDETYSITVVSQSDSINCFQSLSGTFSCEEPCDLEISTDIECFDDDFYTINITITGSSTYSIGDLNGLTAGSYSLGEFANGPYNIVVTDENDSECFQTISGVFECSTEECDLEATLVPECLDETTGEFSLTINLTGSDIYTISDGVNPDLTGQTAGQFVFGPLNSGGYNITITSEADASCFQTYSGTYSCLVPPDCDVAATFLPTCLDDTNYELEMTLIGSSTYTIVGTFANSPITNAGSGVYTLTGMQTGLYSITITDEANDECIQQYAGNYECVDSNCDLQANINYVCSDDLSSYEILFNVTGTGVYSITASNGTSLTNQTANVVSLGSFTNGEYEIVIQDEQDLGCFRTYNGVYFCAPPPECNLSVNSVPTCVDEDFFLNLQITGTSSYTVEVDDVEVLTGVSAGTYPVAPEQGGYNILIYDEFNGNCTQELVGNFSCVWTNECDIESSMFINCINDDQYEIIVTVEGSGLFDIEEMGGYGGGPPEIYEQSVPEGVYTIGPFDNNNGSFDPTTFQVISIFDDDCFDLFWAVYDCTPEVGCDVQVSHEKECNDDDTYNVILTIDGTGTYNIREWFDSFIGPEYENVPAGTYTVGPFDLGSLGYTSYDLVVFDANNEDGCWLNVWGDFFCELSPPCNLFATAEVDCENDGSYFLDIDLSGTDTYTIDWGNGPFTQLTNQTAGTVTIGPLTDDDYEVEITGENTDCFQTITGSAGCTIITEPCALSVSALPSCSADSTNYILIVNLPEGTTYTINYDSGPSDTGITSGTYISNPFENGNYFIEIVDENNPTCSQEISGSYTCVPTDPSCEISFTYTYDCFDGPGGQYTFEFIVEGEGLFDIYTTTAGGSCDQIAYYTGAPVPAGTYTFGPFGENGCPNITVLEQVGNPDCFRELFATASCSPGCQNEVIMDAQCQPDGQFFVEVNIEGDETYTIYEWVDGQGSSNDIPTGIVGVSEGQHFVGPFTNGYDIVVYVDGNEDCFYRDFQDDFNCGSNCNLFASAQVECNEDEIGSYDVTLIVTGNSTYNVYDPNGGGDFTPLSGITAGVHIISGMTVENFDIYIEDVGTEVGNCFQLIEGSTNCDPNPPLCNLTADFTIICNDNGSFNVDITLGGDGVYNVDFSPGPNFNELEAGTYNYGPFNFNNFNIEIEDDNNINCFQNLSGNNPCDDITPACDLIASADIECIPGSTDFNLIIDLSGSSEYTIALADGTNPIGNQTSGTITYGPISGGSYAIEITDEENDDCFQLISGTSQCESTEPCDLNATIDIVCNEDDTYNIEVTIAGSSTYSIIDNVIGESGTGFEFTFETDQFGGECWWELMEVGVGVVFSASPGQYGNFETYTETFDNLNPSATYSLVLHDTFGDGWQFQSTGGDFTVTDIASGAIVEAGNFSNGSQLVLDVGSPTSGGGAGSGFEITDLSAGTYTVGPFESNIYDFIVVDETDGTCAQTFTGNYSCGEPDCNVSASYEVECLPDGSGYNLVIEVRGNGTYIINDGVNPAVTGVTAGFTTIGPLPNGAFNLTIVDQNDDSCNFAIGAFESCEPVEPCDLTVTAEADCIGDVGNQTIEIKLVIGGTSTYTIDDGAGGITNNVAPGEFIVNYASDNVNYTITITDESDSNCNQTLSGTYVCDPLPPCDLNASVDLECVDDFNYNAVLTLTGSSTYTITSGPVTLTGQSAGIIDLGVFGQGNYTIVIQDEANESCSQTLSGLFSCSSTSFCDLSVVAEPICGENSEEEFYLNVTISGTSTYTVFYNPFFFGNFTTVITGLTPGTHEIGPFPEGFYFIQFINENDDECFYNINGSYSCDGTVECNLEASVVPECEDGQLFLDIEINGIGNYNVNVNGFFQGNFNEGNYTFGPFDGPDYNVQIIENDGVFGECNQFIQGAYDCEDECDLDVEFEIECLNNDQFIIALDVEGDGEYQVNSNVGGSQTINGGETVDLGPFNSFYEIEVIGLDFDNCFQTFSGNYTCEETPACDLFVSAETECINETSYNIIVTIEGSGGYDVTINGGNFEAGVPAGTYTYGPFTTEDYFVNVFDPNGGVFGCFQSLQGTRQCTDENICDLSIVATPVCYEDEPGVFYLSIDVTGTSTYTISNAFFGSDPLATGVGEGTIEVGPVTNGFYNVQITDETNGDCFQLLSGNYSCEGSVECDLSVSAVVNCIDEESYEIEVTIEGTGLFDVFDGFIGVILDDVPAGTYTLPTTFFNPDYQIFVQANSTGPFGECSQFISGVQDCSGNCDLTVEQLVNCNDDGSYSVDVTIGGSSTYSINEDFTGQSLNSVSAGTYTFENLDQFGFSLNIFDDNNDCFQNVFGNAPCTTTGGCDLFVNASTECVDDFSFNITMDITGSGTYTVFNNTEGNNVQTNLSAGTYTFGPYFLNSYSFSVFQDDGTVNNCSQFITGTRECSDPGQCDLTVSIEPVCDDASLNTYDLEMNIVGTSSYTIILNGGFGTGGGVQFNGITEGLFVLEDVPEGFYNISVTDETNNDCSQFLNGSYSCDGELECDLEANVTVNCLSDEQYELVLDLTGTGSYFVDIDFISQGNNFTEGTYTFGPFAASGSDNYNMTVTSNNFGVFGPCSEFISANFSCEDGGCTVDAVLDFICSEDNEQFNIDVTITGDGIYDINTFGPGSISGVGAGTYTVGPFNSQDFYFIDVANTNGQCNQSFNGSYFCEPIPGCDLFATITPECIDGESAYYLNVEVSGSGEYVITAQVGGFFGENIDTVFAGSYTYGPFTTTSYFLQFFDITDGGPFGNCFANYSGEIQCFVPTVCDLNVSTNNICVNEDEFNVELTITSPQLGGTFTIDIGDGNPITGVAEGVVSVGPFANGNYEITVSSELNPSCTQTVSGFFQCTGTPPCNLIASATPSCLNDGTADYTVDITISGTGSYSVNDGSDVTAGLTSGTYTFGPYSDVDYQFVITDEANALCLQTVSGQSDCEVIVDPPCDLDVTVEPVCVTTDSYNLELVISGSDTYEVTFINGAFSQTFGDVEPGEYLVEDLTATDYSITITSEQTENCFQSFTGNQDCEDAFNCTLLASVITECVDEDNYNVELTIEGAGSFDVYLNGSDFPVIVDAVAGTYDLGDLPNGDYNVFVDGLDDCDQELTGNFDCEVDVPCDLFANYTLECVGLNGEFELVITVAGSGDFSITDVITDTELTASVVAGEYTFGPFDSDQFEILIESNVVALCNQTISGDNTCVVNPPCDVTATITPICNSETSLSIEVDISGSSTYDIVGAGSGALFADGVSAGVTVLGPFEGNFTQFDIVVVDEADASCSVELGTSVNCNVNCNLNVTSETSCINDGTEFMVILEIEGDGTYSIEPGGLTGVTAGTIEVGPFTGTDYSINITSETIENCFNVVSGIENCDDCDFEVESNTDCNEEFTFTLIVEITGAGTYTIDDGQNPPILNQIAGDVEVGPLAQGEAYEVVISKDGTPDCTKTISGINQCVAPPCDFEVANIINCLNDNEYEIELVISGDGTYTVDDGSNVVSGLTEGSYIVGPFANGGYNVVITSETVDNCFQTIAGINDCTPVEQCDFEVLTDVSCIDEETVVIGLTIVGEGSFTINDGVNEPLTNQSEFVELILPNGAYNISVESEILENCIQVISGLATCPDGCNISASADVACINNIDYFVNISLLSEGPFTLTDGTLTETGVGPQVIAFGPLNSPTYSITVTSDLEPACSFEISGESNCDIIGPNCDLQAAVNTTCIDEFGYDLEIELSGTSTYTIDVVSSPNSPTTGVEAGLIVLSGNDNGNYSVIITDENNPECAIVLNGADDCGFLATCEYSNLSAEAVCNGDLMDVTVTFDAENVEVGDEYTITIGDDVTFNGAYTNEVTQVVEINGITSGNQIDLLTVVVTDALEAGCEISTEFIHIFCSENTASISNFVWEDLNANGMQDDSEPGLEQIIVTLVGSGDDGVFGTDDDTQVITFTNTDGFYAFNDVAPGDYYIQVSIPDGFTATSQNIGNDEIDSDIDDTGITEVFTLNGGDNDPSYDAGLFDACAGFAVEWAQVCPFEYDGTYNIEYSIADNGMVSVTGDVELMLGSGFYIQTYEEGDTVDLTFTNQFGCSESIFVVPEDCPNLSIELLVFDGRTETEGNYLYWTTATEYNNDYFTLERSINGVDYIKLGDVDAVGNSSVSQSYSFMDYEAPLGRSYYRLQTTDLDGTAEYVSNIVVLDRAAATPSIVIAPNPVSDWVTIEYELVTESQKPNLIVYDAAGRLVDMQDLQAQVGVNQHQLDMRAYASGTYFFHLYIDGKMELTEKVIKD